MRRKLQNSSRIALEIPPSFVRLEFFACGPGAFPVLFRRPGFRFEEMEITRATGQLSEMAHRHQGFIDEPVLHLLAIKLESKAVIIGTPMKRLAELLDRHVLRGRRQR